VHARRNQEHLCAYAGDGCGTSIPSFFPDRLPFAVRNQAAQTIVDIKTLCAGTVPIAFEGRNQADVSKAEFGFFAFPVDLKNSVGPGPLSFVLTKLSLASDTRHMTFLPGRNSVIFCVLR
jgi:hypothetical protein